MDLNKSFKDFLLINDNINIEKSEDTTIRFKHNGLIFIFEFIEEDPYYFRIYLPGIFEITEMNREWIDDKISELSFKIKVAKLIKTDNLVWAIADTFVYSMENIENLYARVLSSLVTIYEELKKEFQNRSEQNDIANGN